MSIRGFEGVYKLGSTHVLAVSAIALLGSSLTCIVPSLHNGVGEFDLCCCRTPACYLAFHPFMHRHHVADLTHIQMINICVSILIIQTIRKVCNLEYLNSQHSYDNIEWMHTNMDSLEAGDHTLTDPGQPQPIRSQTQVFAVL